ncbi:hypothetical protein [Nostoc sp. 2RC]|uniref:hypothetical protein n=1 Tax=Nostoc sp. 2RC TaxID=2485484 RepID=UPI0016294ACD|nr:hypothetical protein [Nostoc sp. 2RC]MBC1242045.1 hypothetical protein [Nostoc sp. 2RC]
MQLKSISYKRVLNLGNYENKHLELFAEVADGDDNDAAILELMELVERNIRSQIGNQFQKQIVDLEARKNQLHDEVFNLNQNITKLKKTKEELEKAESKPDPTEPDPDDIPFDPGDTPKNSGDIPNGF